MLWRGERWKGKGKGRYDDAGQRQEQGAAGTHGDREGKELSKEGREKPLQVCVHTQLIVPVDVIGDI